jgi:hypothetical protein
VDTGVGNVHPWSHKNAHNSGGTNIGPKTRCLFALYCNYLATPQKKRTYISPSAKKQNNKPSIKQQYGLTTMPYVTPSEAPQPNHTWWDTGKGVQNKHGADRENLLLQVCSIQSMYGGGQRKAK